MFFLLALLILYPVLVVLEKSERMPASPDPCQFVKSAAAKNALDATTILRAVQGFAQTSVTVTFELGPNFPLFLLEA